MERQLPEMLEVWQHFKHEDCPEKWHQYIIIGRTSPEASGASMVEAFEITHTETGALMEVLSDRSHQVLVLREKKTGVVYSEPHVIYKPFPSKNSLHKGAWARPLNNFMAADGTSERGWKFWRCDACKR